MAWRLVVFTLLAVIASSVQALDGLYEFDTENQRESYKTLSTELRCPKCQNQNLADSNSEISEAMRDVIAEELLSGRTEQEIKDMMVERYGDFVLYKPPVKKETIILWWAPIVFLLVVFLCLGFVVFKRSQYVDDDSDGDELTESASESEGSKN